MEKRRENYKHLVLVLLQVLLLLISLAKKGGMIEKEWENHCEGGCANRRKVDSAVKRWRDRRKNKKISGEEGQWNICTVIAIIFYFWCQSWLCVERTRTSDSGALYEIHSILNFKYSVRTVYMFQYWRSLQACGLDISILHSTHSLSSLFLQQCSKSNMYVTV